MSRHWRSLFLPLALAVVSSRAVSAQATITGTVTDRSTGLPIADAQVFFGSLTVPAITNALGKYRIEGVGHGRDWVMVRRIGYSPLRRAVMISGDSVYTVYVGLDPLPVTLPEIEVRVESGFQVRRLQDFWHRYSTSWGKFTTHEDLERFGVTWLSSLIKMYLPHTPLDRSQVDAWYDVNTNGFQNIGMTTPNGLAARRCPPAISINGNTPWQGDRYVDDYPPSTVEAMEVYKPGTRVPIEFQLYDQAYGCGLVVLWLR
jgi:hypothetical protein